MKHETDKPKYSILLAEALEQASYTHEAAADKMGVARSMVTNSVNGRGSPKVFENLHRLILEDGQIEAIQTAWQTAREEEKTALPIPGLKSGAQGGTGYAKERSSAGDTSTWYCVVEPNRTTRDYTSIDDVELTMRGDRVRATFTRLFPRQHDRGRRWVGIGRADNDDLRLLFKPIRNPHDSRGALVFTCRREERPRLTYYTGAEIRGVDTDHGRIVDHRVSYLYPKDGLPSKYMPAFAALDLDNTLFKGWSIIEWARSLHARRLSGIAELHLSLAELHKAYTATPQVITHDEFAIGAGEAYAAFCQQADPVALEQSAAEFAEESLARNRFYPFAADLIATLREMLIAPVLITGAPQELAVALGAALKIDEVHGFKIQREGDAPHPGTAEGKAAAVRQIVEETHRTFQFAAGDEQSDVLMLLDAPARAATTALVEQNSEFAEDPPTYEFHPRTTAEAFTQWARDTLPDHSLPPE